MLTQEQQATNAVTQEHIHTVQKYMLACVQQLIERAHKHDRSKLESPEVETFTEMTPKLAACTYGSPEYQGFLAQMKPALDHHYGHNRHHPEHFAEGVNEMNLLDLIEMFCDWKAATERHNDGNIRKSIEKNADRFGMSPQLCQILDNTIEVLEAAR